MFRRPRQTTADNLSLRLSKILQPIPVIPWSALAMWYLGVPVGVGAPMIVVQDADYPIAQSRLAKAGFTRSVPNRNPHPAIIASHPSPQQMLTQINAGYHRVDRSCAVFDYPNDDPKDKDMQLYLYLFPNSLAHVFDGWRWQEAPRHETGATVAAAAQRYESYGNLHYALERALVESVVRAAVEEESATGFSAWGEDLRCCVAMMNGRSFGRIREARFGPIDRRVSKRLGSGREMPVDTRGNPI